MSTAALYMLTAVLLVLSFRKDRKKTRQALKKAWKSFENILPQFLSILVLIGLMLAVLDRETITRLLGADSGAAGMAVAAAVGSVTLIPGFIAFPLAASLLSSGAGYGQTAMFLTTLMMVGLVTLPLETTFFGKRLAVMRNALAFVYAVVSSVILGVIL
ncbi:permease [uncultured Mailhella sp.]|uniref:permease n=1 Tax=uncultured Mailhella sp. TaxID=1981031 RepID=UPI0025E1F7BF|nr:permease [uncultured Mailhella sp.]